MTRTSKLTALTIAAALAGACGSKAKKEDTTTEVAEAPEAPAPAVEEEAAPVEEAPADPSASLEDRIYFEFDSAVLSPESREVLDNNAEWLRENPDRSLTIEGHTDEQGTTEYNVALGDERARAARDYLVALGIDESRIEIISYGEERPAVAGEDAKNRRSMFIVQR